MFCPNCGTVLADDMSFCPNCGKARLVIPPKSVASTQEYADTSQQSKEQKEHQKQAGYPVVKRLNVKMAALAFGMGLFAWSAYDMWANLSASHNTKFFDYRTGEIVSAVSSSQVTTYLILLIILAAILVVSLLFLFRKAYQLPCPVCGGNIEISVGTQACDCPLCKERLIYKDGVFLPAKDITKGESGKDAL